MARGCLNALFPIGYPDAHTCADTHEENYGAGHFVTVTSEVVSVDKTDVGEVANILHEYIGKCSHMFSGQPRVCFDFNEDGTVRVTSNLRPSVVTCRSGNPHINLLQGHQFLVSEDDDGILVLGKLVG